MKHKIKHLIGKYGHIWTVSYIFIYMPWFFWLEQRTVPYTVVYSSLDKMIPFSEYFIIPYLLWFLYIPAVFIYFFFKSKEEFYNISKYMFIGMSIALLICTIWPNGQELRLDLNGHDNIFAKIVSWIYTTDTNTNVFPSIHVFNSIGAFVAIAKSQIIPKKHWVRYGAFILTVLICMSTVMLKQHSILDVVGGIGLSIVMYILVYGLDMVSARRTKKVKKLPALLK